tara:strand:+ start:370 stop:534 length:165 start_codon:yes stop_codon:yes gene_type:complete
MILLLFLVLLIQFFTYWIFEPLAFFLEYVLEIRLFPIIALAVLIIFFSAKNIEN